LRQLAVDAPYNSLSLRLLSYRESLPILGDRLLQNTKWLTIPRIRGAAQSAAPLIHKKAVRSTAFLLG